MYREKTSQQLLSDLHLRKQNVLKGVGEARIQKQNNAGKWTARQRIDFFLDEGSFSELDPFVQHQCRVMPPL